MATRPTGTVTFLFTDIEGSTTLWEQHHDSMERAHKRQEQIIRDAVARHNGYTYKMIGDAFQIAFATATHAITAALDAQRALHKEDWGELGAIRVRMALHTGVTEERGDDYVGPVLNRVARLMSAGHGGQVLLTQATFDLVRDRLPKNFTFRDLGEHRLKDLVRPERVYQIFSPDLPSEFPLLKTLDTQTVSGEPPSLGEPPFKGLHYFDEADADIFFGRELLAAKLVSRLKDFPLLVVIGASGSGKSSLVRAGLIPALKSSEPLADGTSPPEGSAQWSVHVITPTARPLEALAVSLTRDSTSVAATTTLMDDLARDARSLHLFVRKLLTLNSSPVKGEERMLLVVDQFEELFTLCRDEAERRGFIDNLLTATSPKFSGATIVVITLRADFYAHCAHYAELREVVAKHQEYIGPMNPEELRRAIQGPAQYGKWEFEAGLLDLILHDVGDEPGTLPLLSHALLETWERRRGRRLTLKGYDECGGVRGAIAETAESVYQNLAPEQQAIARNIFLRLTALGEGTQDTRRRATLSELIPPFVDAQAADAVLKLLADARLVTTSEGYAEVAHEALIREWPTLREWLSQNREGLRLHRHLTEAAQEWEQLKRDAGALYRGARLAQAIEWAEVHPSTGSGQAPAELNFLEREFLDASKELKEQEEKEREAQRSRELVAAQQLAEEKTRAAQKLRQRAVFLAVALFIAALLAASSAIFAQQANQNAERAENERRTAFVRELSVNAVSNLEVDPERSILLALQAVSASTAGGKPVLREAEEALHQAVQTSRVQLTLRGHTATVVGIAFSPDGRRIATASRDTTAKVWDAVTGQELLTLSGHTDFVNGIAYSPDGKRLATASSDKTVKVWDATTGKELLTLTGHTDRVSKVVFSPDGTRLVTSSGLVGADTVDHTAKVWDAATGKELLTLMGHTNGVPSVAFSPDGRRLATASHDKTAKIWDAVTGKELLTLTGHTGVVPGVAFSPNGKRLATGSGDGTVKVWDAATGQLLMTILAHVAAVNSVAFDSAGTRMATTSTDGKAKVWDSANGQLLLTLAGHSATANQAVFSPDDTRVATASSDTTAKVWDVSPAGGREWLTLANHTGGVLSVAYSTDGRRIATASADKTAKVWDALTGKELLTLCCHADELRDIVFSPDGSRLVTSSNDQTLKVWDATTGKELLTIPTQSYRTVYGLHVAISPDGQRIAAPGPGIIQTTTGTGVLKLWDIKSGKEVLTLSGHKGAVYAVAFSPDGKRIATGSSDRTVKVWDAETGKELLTLVGNTGPVLDVSFSPDGRQIATNGGGGPKVWDAASGQVLLTLTGHTGQARSSVFSPDGTRLATASGDGTTKVWDVSLASGRQEQPLTLYGHSAAVFRAVFNPDGKRLATASSDGTARVYALPLEDILAIAKSRVTRALTPDECQKFLHVEKCPP